MGQGLANSLGKESSIGDIPRNVRNSYNADDASVGKAFTATGKAIVALGKSVVDIVKDYNDPDRQITVEEYFPEKFEIHSEGQQPAFRAQTDVTSEDGIQGKSQEEQEIVTVSVHSDYDTTDVSVGVSRDEDTEKSSQQPLDRSSAAVVSRPLVNEKPQESSSIREKKEELSAARKLQHEAYQAAKSAQTAKQEYESTEKPDRRSEEYKGLLKAFKEAIQVFTDANNAVGNLDKELEALQRQEQGIGDDTTDVSQEPDDLVRDTTLQDVVVDEEKVDMDAFLEDFNPNISIRDDQIGGIGQEDSYVEVDLDMEAELNDLINNPTPLETKTKANDEPIKTSEKSIEDTSEKPWLTDPEGWDKDLNEVYEALGGDPDVLMAMDQKGVRDEIGSDQDATLEKFMESVSLAPNDTVDSLLGELDSLNESKQVGSQKLLSPEDQEQLNALKKKLDIPKSWSLIAVSRVSDEVRSHILNFPSDTDAAKLLKELETNPKSMTGKQVTEEMLADKKLGDIMKIKKLYDAGIDFETGMKK